MRKIILLTCIAALLFVSCGKSVEERIFGKWQLQAAWRQRTFNRDYFTTGYESGIFTFNENGTASYISNTDTLTGNWQAEDYTVSQFNSASGQTETRQLRHLKIELVNFIQNRYLFWEFDDFNFRNTWRTLRAEDFSLSNDRIYEFDRQ